MFFVSSGWLSCCDLRKKLLVLNHHRSRTTSPSHQSVFYSQMEGSSSRGGRIHESLLPNYKLGKTLGIGAFGKVKLAVHTLTGHEVAVKILNRQMINTAETEERVRREIKLLRLFTHPHIIRLYEVIEMRSNIYVVTEYVKSGELFYYIMERGRLQEDEARRFFQQIISGVECCHMNMVAHRDLKPENLLLDAKCNIKIADFGLSNIIRDGHFLKTACGSPNYAAPEVISGKLYSGPEVDIWSCGVILYALLCGTLPFDDDSLPNLFKKIKGGIYTLPSHLSAGARDLIPRILVVDPTKRITIPEIRRHPWFQAHLPYYIAVPAIVEVQKVKKIDEEIVREMTKMGFDWNIIVESFQNRLQNEATVTYHLLSDAQFQFAGGYLGAEFQESSEYGFSRTHTYSASSSTSHSPPTYMDQVSGSRPQDPAERKWSLGLQSQARPSEIMTEVLKALQELDVCWKKIGHYNMKCKWLPNFPGNPETTVSIPNHMSNVLGKEYPTVDNGVGIRSNDGVKFEMQLYKTREAKYLLDLQKVNGSSSLFLNICDAFLTQLQVM